MGLKPLPDGRFDVMERIREPLNTLGNNIGLVEPDIYLHWPVLARCGALCPG